MRFTQRSAYANAIAAAMSVERKFTPLFPTTPRLSSVAPSRLSASVPAIPAPAHTRIGSKLRGPNQANTMATATAATQPANVPDAVIAPLLPGSTSRQLETNRGLPPIACPISLATVSATASQSAAHAASANRGCDVTIIKTVAPAATPKFANTCIAVRPDRASAVPIACFRAYPNRVEAHVRRKTARRVANPAHPNPANSAKQTTPPAAAPEFVTPRTNLPPAAKAIVTAAASNNFGELANTTTAKI